MTETVHFSRITREDVDLGDGTRDVRLADGSLHTLNRVQLGNLLLTLTKQQVATASAAQLSLQFATPAGARIHGVTVKNVVGIGNSNGTTSYDVGDAVLMDRWASSVGITIGTETTSADFQSGDQPIVSANYTVLITPTGGLFDGTGTIEAQVHYSIIRHL